MVLGLALIPLIYGNYYVAQILYNKIIDDHTDKTYEYLAIATISILSLILWLIFVCLWCRCKGDKNKIDNNQPLNIN